MHNIMLKVRQPTVVILSDSLNVTVSLFIIAKIVEEIASVIIQCDEVRRNKFLI